MHRLEDIRHDIMKYDSIITNSHYTSRSRPHMPIGDRAAQFAPFAALTGYGDAIDETARYTDRKIELDENEKERLDISLAVLQGKIKEQPAVTVTYFVPDERKSGGKYITVSKLLKKIDITHRCMVFTDGEKIKADDVVFLELTESSSRSC